MTALGWSLTRRCTWTFISLIWSSAAFFMSILRNASATRRISSSVPAGWPTNRMTMSDSPQPIAVRSWALLAAAAGLLPSDSLGWPKTSGQIGLRLVHSSIKIPIPQIRTGLNCRPPNTLVRPFHCGNRSSSRASALKSGRIARYLDLSRL